MFLLRIYFAKDKENIRHDYTLREKIIKLGSYKKSY